MYFRGMCVNCGALEGDSNESIEQVEPRDPLLDTRHRGLRVTRGKAVENNSSENENLLRQRKLCLFVDLDQTIIHATCDQRYSIVSVCGSMLGIFAHV